MKLLGRIGQSGWNLLVSSAGEVTARLLGFGYLIILARYLNPAGFGHFNALLAYYTLAAVLGSFGLDRLALRNLARDQESAGSLFTTLLNLRVLASAVAAIVLVVVGRFLEDAVTVHFVILGLALVPSGVASAYGAGFQAREQFGEPAVAAGISAGVLIVSALLGAILDASLVFFLWGVFAAESGRALWLVARDRQRGWKHRILGIDPQLAGTAIRTSAIYWVLAVLGVVYFRVDLIMLDLMIGGDSVGFYAGAFRVLEVLAVPSALVMGVLFPRFARLQGRDPDAARRLYLSSLKLLVWGGIGLAVIGMVLARPLVTLLFSSAYLESTGPLLWLMLALVFMFWHAPNATVLFAGDRLIPIAALSLLTAFFNVLANFLLIPEHGSAGAAAATAASELLSLIVFTPLVCHRLKISPPHYLGNVLWPRLSRADLNLLLGKDPRPPLEKPHHDR